MFFKVVFSGFRNQVQSTSRHQYKNKYNWLCHLRRHIYCRVWDDDALISYHFCISDPFPHSLYFPKLSLYLLSFKETKKFRTSPSENSVPSHPSHTGVKILDEIDGAGVADGGGSTVSATGGTKKMPTMDWREAVVVEREREREEGFAQICLCSVRAWLCSELLIDREREKCSKKKREIKKFQAKQTTSFW